MTCTNGISVCVCPSVFCSTSFSTTYAVYYNMAGVYICMCGVGGTSCKWKCYTGLNKCQGKFIVSSHWVDYPVDPRPSLGFSTYIRTNKTVIVNPNTDQYLEWMVSNHFAKKSQNICWQQLNSLNSYIGPVNGATEFLVLSIMESLKK